MFQACVAQGWFVMYEDGEKRRVAFFTVDQHTNTATYVVSPEGLITQAKELGKVIALWHVDDGL